MTPKSGTNVKSRTPSSQIAEKNDRLRRTFSCTVCLSPVVAASPDRDAILVAIRTFRDFTPDNDPHGEHDFGAVVVNGQRYFFKFDYYDAAYRCFQEDGKRVLTIMRADEY